MYLLPILILRFKAFQAFSLRCYQEPVAPNIFIVLNQTAVPANFNLLSRSGLAQSEMQAHVTMRRIASATLDLAHLHASARGYLDARSDSASVAPRANGSKNEPAVIVRCVVPQEVGSLIGVGDKNINITVVVKISKSRAAAYSFQQQPAARRIGHIVECTIASVQKKADFAAGM